VRLKMSRCCPIVELRRYTLHPGKREALITLFEREFIETQEDAGMQLIAQFRDLDQPDVFTWLRGFTAMDSRAAALAAFYDGPTWRAHRETANDTMIDSDNVLLLRPVQRDSGFVFAKGDRPTVGSTSIPPGLFLATIYSLAGDATKDFPDLFNRVLKPELIAGGATPLAVLETEPSRNTFPRLPVREDKQVFVWFARFADVRAYERYVATLEKSRSWLESAAPALATHLAAPVETLRLTPTERSRSIV
jgi:quinol monooxygenase YgiN